MTSALAQQFDFLQVGAEADFAAENDGAHSLLRSHSFRPAYLAQGAAILAYALALVGLCYLSKPKPIPQDQPIELTMVSDDTPAPDQPLAEQTPPDVPPVTDPTPEQTALATPELPPDQDLTAPPADQESVAPVAPPPPPVAVKHQPRQKAARTTSSRHLTASNAGGASNALPSYYANEVHARVARVAGDTAPDGFQGSGRVRYHLVIGPSGSLISKNISSSGNATFDRAAQEALARAAPFPPTGMSRPVSLYGAIAYRSN